MPVVYDPIKEEEERKRREGGQSTSQKILTGASRPAMGSTSGDKGGIRGSSSGGFTNLQAYLKAAQGQQFGKEVAGKVGDIQRKGAEAAAAHRGSTNTAITAGTHTYDSREVQGIFANPEDEANQGIWRKKYWHAQYGGPTTYTENANERNNLNRGITWGRFLVNPEKREKVIQDVYVEPGKNYTRGMNKLDALIAGRTGGNVFAERAAEANRLEQGRQNWQNYFGGAVGNAVATTTNTAEMAANALATNIGETERGIEENASNYKERMTNIIDHIRAAVAAGDLSTLTPEEFKILGINPEEYSPGTSPLNLSDYTQMPELGDNFWNYYVDIPTINGRATGPARVVSREGGFINNWELDPGSSPNAVPKLNISGNQVPMYGLNLGTYLNFANPDVYTKETVTSPEEYAKFRALNALGNQEPTWNLAENIPSDIVGESLKDPVAFDQNRFMTDWINRQAGANEILNAPSSYLRSSPSGLEPNTLGAYEERTSLGGAIQGYGEEINKWANKIKEIEALPVEGLSYGRGTGTVAERNMYLNRLRSHLARLIRERNKLVKQYSDQVQPYMSGILNY